MLEIIAGSLSPSDDPANLIQREIFEEAGLQVSSFNFTGVFFLSPGGSSERCFLYQASIDTCHANGRIAGEAGTTEETIVEVVSYDQAASMIRNGQIIDAKTIIAIQQLLLGWISE